MKMPMPREAFEAFMAPLQAADAAGLTRDPTTGWLEPTETTETLFKFSYAIRKGSVSDRLFHLDTLDPPPPPPRPPPKTVQEIDGEEFWEVERILGRRLGKNKREEYLIRWRGWAPSYDSWEPTRHVNKHDRDVFHGRQEPKSKRRRGGEPVRPHRGAGCARAHLSAADQRRGGVPQSMSMVCGNVLVEFCESIDRSRMPRLKLTYYVLTMNKDGHIVWPTLFDAQTQAQLRRQARVLLQRMINDPLNPVDTTMAPALTGAGSSELWQGAPARQLVPVE